MSINFSCAIIGKKLTKTKKITDRKNFIYIKTTKTEEYYYLK